MAGYERKLGLHQLSVDDMKVGPAYRARKDTNQKLSRARLWGGQIGQPQRPAGSFEEHRPHGSNGLSLKALGQMMQGRKSIFSRSVANYL
jgi:hypothetical protein